MVASASRRLSGALGRPVPVAGVLAFVARATRDADATWAGSAWCVGRLRGKAKSRRHTMPGELLDGLRESCAFDPIARHVPGLLGVRAHAVHAIFNRCRIPPQEGVRGASLGLGSLLRQRPTNS